MYKEIVRVKRVGSRTKRRLLKSSRGSHTNLPAKADWGEEPPTSQEIDPLDVNGIGKGHAEH